MTFKLSACLKIYYFAGPINNKSLVLNRQIGPTLRPNVDHYKFGETIWRFLMSLYGGGPEVVITNEGMVRVTSPAPVPSRNIRMEDLHLED